MTKYAKDLKGKRKLNVNEHSYYIRGKFVSYETSIMLRAFTNYKIVNLNGLLLKEYSHNKRHNAMEIVVDDLHTIIDSICDFYA